MRAYGLIVVLVVAGLSGCGMARPNARYIYQDGEFGVIGIPQNSPYGRRDYLKQAESLMARHFPDGYEIVRAEEVVEGQRVLDKSRKAEIETDPTISALNQKIQVGKLAQTTTTQQKDSLPILESRIIYKKKGVETPAGVHGFASSAKLSPELYLDPNEMARCREKIELADLHKAKTSAVAANEKSKDDEAKKAIHETDAVAGKPAGDSAVK
jgi:hypothetical protein